MQSFLTWKKRKKIVNSKGCHKTIYALCIRWHWVVGGTEWACSNVRGTAGVLFFWTLNGSHICTCTVYMNVPVLYFVRTLTERSSTMWGFFHYHSTIVATAYFAWAPPKKAQKSTDKNGRRILKVGGADSKRYSSIPDEYFSPSIKYKEALKWKKFSVHYSRRMAIFSRNGRNVK